MEACAYSAWLGVTKPDARMYRHVVDRLGVEPERCTYVGDGNSHELRGAHALGMRTVWVDNGEGPPARHQFDEASDLRITELRQLLDLGWGESGED
jgi:FMN phosphatase YigB (HAD superfamily)